MMKMTFIFLFENVRKFVLFIAFWKFERLTAQ